MSEESKKENIEILKRTVKFFDSLLTSLIDGIVITDETQNIIVVNEAFCAFFGWNRREVIETKLFDWLNLLGGDILSRWTELTKRLYVEGSCRDVKFQVQAAHGIRYFSVNASLMKSAPSERTNIVSIWHDVTERSMLEEALRQKLDEVERLNKLMVGRELKMEEMRKEIQRLKARIEELRGE